jgi:serine/threonine-protein kinase HipA
MSECRLLEEGGRAHFMTRRFDRTPEGGPSSPGYAGTGKLHLQTLCGIAHMDFNQAGAYSYEQAFQVARQLGLSQPEEAELYRRALFNILARNQEDHTKNISFLMDRTGRWRLAPAYDVIYSYNPNGAWTSRHQMSLVGKRDGFTGDDLLAAAPAANLKARQAKGILEEVRAAVSEWQRIAVESGVTEKQAGAIARTHRMM